MGAESRISWHQSPTIDGHDDLAFHRCQLLPIYLAVQQPRQSRERCSDLCISAQHSLMEKRNYQLKQCVADGYIPIGTRSPNSFEYSCRESTPVTRSKQKLSHRLPLTISDGKEVCANVSK